MKVGFWLAGLAGAVAACAQTLPTTLRGAAAPIPLLISAAADGSEASPDPLATDPAYGATLAAQYNMLEPENAMKWGSLHPNPPGSSNEYNFAAGDELVAFAQANGMKIRGHNLLWYIYNPNWLAQGAYSSAQLYTIMQNHITTVVNHYKGQVFAWDVVNEAIDDNSGTLRNSIWYNQPGIGLTGSGYIEQAFRWAHAADPDALLFYNEYSIEDQSCWLGVSSGDGTKFPALYAMVSDFVSRGVPINGVGFQMHIDAAGCPTSAVLAQHIQKITALGLAVHITEMDVKIPDTSISSLQAQAQTYQRILNICLQNPGCTAFQTWGFADNHTWEPTNFPLPFDSNYQPKPAFTEMMNVLNAAQPPPASSCTYSVPSVVNVSGAGGVASIAVTTWPACIWNIAGLPDWIGAPAAGKGAAIVPLTVAANSGAARSATVSVAGTPVTVTEDAACTYAVHTVSDGFSLAGGSATIPVTAGSGCPWSASSTLDWVTFTGPSSGSGDGSVTIQAARDTGAGRSGVITVAGHTVTISEGALRFVPVTPCRVADTRNSPGAFGGPAMTAASTRSFAIPESGCVIPATAQAYSLNVTVVPPGALSYLTLWPTGQPQPMVSTLNSFQGLVVANAAIVPAGEGGAVNVYVTNPTHVVLDINGYFDSGSGGSYSFYPVSPCRIADTRGTAGPFGGPALTAGESRDFAILASGCTIPNVPSAYSLNVTAVPAGYLGFLTTWPEGVARPLVSTLNSWTGKVVANAALVPAGTNDSVSVYASNPTNVVLDINGYFGQFGNPGALSFYPVAPCRVADTRGGSGPLGAPILEAQTSRSFPIPSGPCGIPANASAYSMNVTVVPDGVLPYLTAWPTGSTQPMVSTLNSFDGTVTANAAIIPAGENGAISIYVAGRTHVILDIDGYFAP